MEKIEAFRNYIEILIDKAKSNGDHNGVTAIKALQDATFHAKVEEYALWHQQHAAAPYIQNSSEIRRPGTL